jgi:NADH-quinone oxidoreductase subunit L
MEKFLYITLFAPFVGSLFAAMFGARPKMMITGIVTSALLFVSFVSAVFIFFYVSNGAVIRAELFDWIIMGDLNMPFGFVADQVSATMMLVVTLVSTIVHIYSIGYMKYDKGFNRFFSYLSAFVFSMLVLVMSDNFGGLFIGWEGVGLCSWLLIGFWYHKESAAWAANEAFIMNRVADLGMLIGLFLIYWQVGSLQYDVVFANIASVDVEVVLLIGIFLFIGAMGKSAQFPFHPWLADAMEGPTPVSALIHAATMVTAGVYLVIRANELFALIPEMGYFIASLGAFVAIFAASMALVNEDLKRIIAYSTLSQLGYMFVAAGLGAYWVALFHLMTHAFFKALLFLGAGNVMHAMDDELNIKKMGGLYPKMKFTAILMILASVALAGIYPLAGFFSKDAILEVAFIQHHFVIWAVLWITAGLTAFYSFRLIMLVFFGKEEYKNYGFDPHEAYKFMLYAMTPLGVLAVIAGWFKYDVLHMLEHTLPGYHPIVASADIYALIVVTSLVAVSGIWYAIYRYKNGGFDKKWENRVCYKMLKAQYYIPELYAKACDAYLALSRVAWKLDVKVVDAIVDFIGKVAMKGGECNSNAMHSGNLSKMLRWMAIGMLMLMAVGFIFALIGSVG